MKKTKWNVGVTTCLQRKDTLLAGTIASLCDGGFDDLRLFVDGCTHEQAIEYEDTYGYEVTSHHPNVRTAGNWHLALLEMWHRDPHARYYGVFQDDFVCSLNLRSYLNQTLISRKFQEYFNLYTFPQNQKLCPTGHTGWFKTNQLGKGAVALVFTQKAVMALLGSQKMADRVVNPTRGWKAIDGGISVAMKKAGYVEHCHNPSLIQHVGDESSMGNKKHPMAESFKGEDFDLLELL